MQATAELTNAAIATYFASRLTLRLPLPLGQTASLVAAHGLALALVAALMLGWHSESGSFSLYRIVFPILAQAGWLLIDDLRKRSAGSVFL